MFKQSAFVLFMLAFWLGKAGIAPVPAQPAEALPGQPAGVEAAAAPELIPAEAPPGATSDAPAAGATGATDPLTGLLIGALGATLGISEAAPAPMPGMPLSLEGSTLGGPNVAGEAMEATDTLVTGAGDAMTTSSQDTDPSARRIGGYFGFWYQVEVVDEDSGTTAVQRVQMPGDEYEERKRSEEENVWFPRYSAFLNGNYMYAEPDIPAATAQAMVQVDPETANRMRTDPAFLDELARRMAKWTVYYDQLNLWREYVNKEVLRTNDYAFEKKEEPKPFDTATLDTELPAAYDEMRKQAEAISELQYQAYLDVINSVEKTVRAQEDFDAWLADRRNEVLEFAQEWGKQNDGSQLNVGGNLYLVRSPKAAPSKPEAAQEEKVEYMPRNAVILEVPKQKVVTPFDLLNPDGTLKQPEER